MNTPAPLRAKLRQTAERNKNRLVEITRDLVRIPSENTPPYGAELACQEWLAKQLARLDLSADLYCPTDVPGLEQHALYQPGREFSNRPNLAARRNGAGGGRSLVLSGHIDTVPRGTQAWDRDPFSGHIEQGRIYGRGSNDMKAGVAANLFVLECLRELDIQLAGDLTFETVVDEEFGGCTGTLAGRLRGYNGDAAIITESTSLRICPAQRGGRTAHIQLRSASAGVLDNDGGFPAGVIPQLSYLLTRLPEFAAQRKQRSSPHPLYASQPDPVPVSVTKVHTSPWGWKEPITVPDTALVEIYWQLMPGEMQSHVDAEFSDWIASLVNGAPGLFTIRPEVSKPIRWMPGSAISKDEPLVWTFDAAASEVLGASPRVEGIEGPCDLFIFQQAFDIPAILWGPSGSNVHSANEYVEIDSLVKAASALLLFVVEWCRTA